MDSLDPTGVDAVVLAGDIAVADGIGPALELVCRRYPDAIVVYVHGNHEYYGSNREVVFAHTRHACEAHANLRWLDCSVAEIAGRRFLGAPLWFPEAREAAAFKRHMTDFTVIESFESWVYDDNARAVAFLEAEVRSGDIVVTHHLPSPQSVSARFVGHPLTPFFVCDLEPLIRERTPAYWLHGHTHDSLRYAIGPTTVACNPFGYVGHELNTKFEDQLVFDV